MPLPALHMIGCFHTKLDDAHAHCAFSGKARRFPKMMRLAGYHTIVYCNAGSETEADEQVIMLSNEEFDTHYPKQKPTDFHGSYATIGERGWPLFHSRLCIGLLNRLKPGDIICHPFGRAHQTLTNIFPHIQQFETGIGYQDAAFGCWRIFESETWRAWHWGRETTPSTDRGTAKSYSFVIPNYFDLDEWPTYSGMYDYVAYMGRLTPEKGMSTLVEIIRADAGKTEFRFAGQGDFEGLIQKPLGDGFSNVRFAGPITGRDRAAFVGNARCTLMPTEFIEPFGGSGVEAMLTSTPLISSNYGAFVETVEHGVTGYRCNTLADWLAAIEASKHLDRATVARIARSKYSLETCAKMYDAAFRQIADLSDKGWYSPNSYRIP